MSNPKERHYWTQLRAALTAGQWRSSAPAKTPSGTALTWSELFRKFNKHCKGFQDVAEVASQTRSLAKLLSEPYPDEDEDAEVAVSTGASEKRGQLDLHEESMLAEKYVEMASNGYTALKALGSSNSDTIYFALAYYSYAFGNPKDCLSLLGKVPGLLQFQNHIPSTGSTRSTAQNSLAPSSYAPSIMSYTGSFTSLVENIVPEVRDGRGWAMVETFRSLCLQGMSHERLSPSEAKKALHAYAKALPLFSSLQSEFTQKSIPQSSGKLDFTVFYQLRELWRWVERLLWRAIVLSSRVTRLPVEEQPEPRLWNWLDHYATCSAYWPPTFRTVHRSTVYSLHLRAVVLRASVLSPSPFHFNRTSHPYAISSTATSVATSSSVSTTQTQLTPQSSTSTTNWLHSARSIVQEYRAILTSSTKFPCAGQRNIKVEEFVDLCVAIWEAHGAVGEQAGWVIDILWWATRITFNSSRVLRHMYRLLYLAGDVYLAKRTLNLYIQVVGKAYEASKEGIGEDKDTDMHWVDTLVFGARMLLKIAVAQPGLEGIDDVKEAGLVLEKARTRLDLEDKKLVSKLLLAEGIYWSLLAIKGHDPLTRTTYLEKAHVAFQESLLAHTTPSGYYHLALSFARRGGPTYDLDQAIEYAGHAVAGEPKEVRYWHLLGILLTGAEKWAEAKEILEHGADLDLVDEDGDEEVVAEHSGDEATVTQSETQTLVVPGTSKVTDFTSGRLNGHDASIVKPTNVKSNGVGVGPKANLYDTVSADAGLATSISLLEPNAIELPPAETLLKSIEITFDGYPPSKVEWFEWHLQIRMTQVALMEIVEGAEGAESGWVDVFSWVAERRGPTSADTTDDRRQSLEGPQLSIDRNSRIPPPVQGPTITQPSDHLGAHDLEKKVYSDRNLTSPLGGTSESLLVPIPIMISPATPDEETVEVLVVRGTNEGEKEKEKNKKEKDEEKEREKKSANGVPSKSKRSTSLERNARSGDTTKTKKVQRILKDQVHKGRAGITAVSRKIGHGVTKNGPLRRSNSSPNFHVVLQQISYQASSIHSRRRLSSIIHSQDRTPTESPPPPPPPTAPPPPTRQDFKLKNDRLAKGNRLLSELWLMSAATFRRLGKIEQAKGSIQEAEVKDQSNPNVWVQLGLYYIALRHYQHAVDTLQKALFICSDDVSATVYLSKLYLDPEAREKLRPASNATMSSSASSTASTTQEAPTVNSDVDLAAGILAYLTKGRGWDAPEAWYYLAKAYGMQGRKQKERETLRHALELSEKRGVRDIGLALGWCI